MDIQLFGKWLARFLITGVVVLVFVANFILVPGECVDAIGNVIRCE